MAESYHAKRLLKDLERFEKSTKISEDNRQTISKFLELMRANGVSPATLRLTLWALSTIATIFNRSFQEATKDDIIKIVGGIESKYKSEKSKRHLKAELKRFYKWLRNTKEYPEEVAWVRLNYKTNNTKLPEEILTKEEIEKLANCCLNLRNKAMVLVLYESGCRIGELLSLKIKNVQFDLNGAVLLVDGKTGQRRVRIVEYAKDLMNWLEVHPLRDNPEAPVWVSLGVNTKNRLISYVEVEHILSKLGKKAGINKKSNPHAFRHARATHLAKHLPEAIMKEIFGWTKDSKMASIYYHLSGEQVDDALLSKVYGIKQNEEKKPVAKICIKCGELNSLMSNFCKKCSTPLVSIESVLEMENKRNEFDNFVKDFLVYYAGVDKNFKKAFVQFVKERKAESLFGIDNEAK